MDRRREVAERYASNADPYTRFWAPVLQVLSEPLFSRIPGDGARVLDVGCGPGVVSSVLAERGARLVGVDLTEAMARRAPLQAVVGDAERLPFASSSFDAALSTFVLQHTPWASRVFARVAAALRPRGVFATATWGAGSAENTGPWAIALAALEDEGAPEIEGIKTWHERVDTAAKMRRLARAAGFAEADAWVVEHAYAWEPEVFLGWIRCQRGFGARLEALPDEARSRVLDRIDREISAASAEQLLWTSHVVYCCARTA